MKKTQVSSIYLSYNNRRRMFLGKRMRILTVGFNDEYVKELEKELDKYFICIVDNAKDMYDATNFRITSYNVCYTKLLRRSIIDPPIIEVALKHTTIFGPWISKKELYNSFFFGLFVRNAGSILLDREKSQMRNNFV